MWNDPDIAYRLMMARVSDRLAAADPRRLLRKKKATTAAADVVQPAEDVPYQAA